MKKFKSLIIPLIIILVCYTNVYAQDGSTTLTYTLNDSFWIMIPETIQVGETGSLYAEQLNVAPGHEVYVTITNLNEFGGITLYNEYDDNSYINIGIFDSGGNSIDPQNPILGTFANSGTTVNFTTFADYANDLSHAAGNYTGVINFDIYCQ